MVKQIYAKPCIGCGSCCRVEICHHGMLFLKKFSPPCPALEQHSGKYCCGLIVNTSKYIYPGALSDALYNKIRQYLMETFEFGVGCDSKLRYPDSHITTLPLKH